MCKDNSLQKYDVKDDACTIWDLEPMDKGPWGISKDTSTMLLLFCATYSHLIMVLNDEEFYGKHVCFLFSFDFL